MAVRYIQVDKTGGRGLRFPESKLAQHYCRGRGIELGAASHNRFSLRGAINVAPVDDFEFYKKAQVELDGSYAVIDINAEAHCIPLPDRSQNFVISSHVVEHLPDLIAAFKE